MGPSIPTAKRAYRQKNRSITSCTECHRRKQGCNRQKPCNYCVDRGIPKLCAYKGDLVRESSSLAVQANVSSPMLTPTSASSPSVNHDRASEYPRMEGQNDPQGSFSAIDRTTDDLSNTLGYSYQAAAHTPEVLPKQLLKHLPPPKTIQLLVDVFFSEANWYFTVLDRYFFDLQYHLWLRGQSEITQERFGSQTGGSRESAGGQAHGSGQPSIADIHFPALLLQLLALACQFLPSHLTAAALRSSGHKHIDTLSETLSNAGEELMTYIGRYKHSMSAVEADLMRCAWLKNCGRGTDAWFSLGTAIRSAQEQKLEQEPLLSPDLRDQWYSEHKRRLWACLLSWESHMALQLGRSRMINLADCSIRPPMDCDMPEDPSRTLFAGGEAPSHYTSAIIKYRLALLIHELMDLGAFKRDRVRYADIWRAHTDVQEILKDLPRVVQMTDPDESWDTIKPELVRHRLQIAIIANSFLVSMHRPHVFNKPESLDAVITAAKIVLAKSQDLFNVTEPHQHKIYTNVFYTIDAALVLCAIVSTLSQEDPERSSLLEAIRKAVRRLAILKARNTAAVPAERTLLRFLNQLDGNASASAPIQDQATQFAVISGPLSTDPMQTLETLMSSESVEPRRTAAVENVVTETSVSSIDSAVFMDVVQKRGYTSEWLESFMNSQ